MRPMKRILISVLVALTTLCAQSLAHAAEGRIAELQAPPLDAARVAHYSEARGTAQLSVKTKSAKQYSARAATKTAPLKSARPAAMMSPRFSDFSFFDAGSVLLGD